MEYFRKCKQLHLFKADLGLDPNASPEGAPQETKWAPLAAQEGDSCLTVPKEFCSCWFLGLKCTQTAARNMVLRPEIVTNRRSSERKQHKPFFAALFVEILQSFNECMDYKILQDSEELEANVQEDGLERTCRALPTKTDRTKQPRASLRLPLGPRRNLTGPQKTQSPNNRWHRMTQ